MKRNAYVFIFTALLIMFSAVSAFAFEPMLDTRIDYGVGDTPI
ncbi:MAG: hypothetical protein U9N55_06210 [candidate division Zixibacteria bacterium]|nr:hypothetical protein [candidate division Zixibacteria bacterium]